MRRKEEKIDISLRRALKKAQALVQKHNVHQKKLSDVLFEMRKKENAMTSFSISQKMEMRQHVPICVHCRSGGVGNPVAPYFLSILPISCPQASQVGLF